jgi:hypothetical protein
MRTVIVYATASCHSHGVQILVRLRYFLPVGTWSHQLYSWRIGYLYTTTVYYSGGAHLLYMPRVTWHFAFTAASLSHLPNSHTIHCPLLARALLALHRIAQILVILFDNLNHYFTLSLFRKSLPPSSPPYACTCRSSHTPLIDLDLDLDLRLLVESQIRSSASHPVDAGFYPVTYLIVDYN